MADQRDQDGQTGAGRGVTLLRCYLCAVALLAPLRFGSVITPGEISTFPASGTEWLFANWPPFLLGALAGIGLLWAVWLRGSLPRRYEGRMVLWVWGALPLAALIGLWQTTEWDAALTFLLYLFGVAAFLAASMIMLRLDSSYRYWLLAAVVAGTLYCSLNGWYQRLWGFEEMRRFAVMEAERTGRPISAALQGKLLQTRVYRPFFLPNSYAAHLILTAPLVLLCLWRAGGRFEPARVSRVVFLFVGGIVVLGALLLSQSRGALLAVGGGLGLGLISLPALRRWRWPILGGSLLAGIGLMMVVNQGRDLLSASARFQYYLTALRIYAQHPFVGAGLGEFFPRYLALKPLGAEETRAAHNMILTFLSEAGPAGALAAVACVALPLLPVVVPSAERASGDTWMRAAVVAGTGAWSLHALLDFDIQIPPTVMLAATLPLLAFSDSSPSGDKEGDGGRRGRLERPVLVVLGVVACAALWRLPGEYRYRTLSDAAESATVSEVRDLAATTAAALPFSPYPQALCGRVALADGRPAVAVEAFEQAFRRTPHRAAFALSGAEARLAMGEWREAGDLAGRAWHLYPGNARAAMINALLAVLADRENEGSERRDDWIRTVLHADTEGHLEEGVFVVEVALEAGGSRRGPTAKELCAAFNRLGWSVPGSGVSIRFEPKTDSDPSRSTHP